MKTQTKERSSLEKEVKITWQRKKITLSYQYWPGRGRPIVCLHGLMDSSHGWNQFAKRSRHPVIALDLPGFGNSSVLRGPASIDTYADIVGKAILRIPELQKNTTESKTKSETKSIILTGHSLGGAIATSLSNKNILDGIITDLVLFAPAGFGRTHSAELFSFLLFGQTDNKYSPKALKAIPFLPFTIATNFIVNHESLVDASYRYWVSNGKSIDPTLKTRFISSLTDSSKRKTTEAGLNYAVKALAKISYHSFGKNGDEAYDLVNLRRKATEGEIEVKAVWGTRDRLVSIKSFQRLQQVIPSAELISLEGVGHHPQRETPRRVLNILDKL